MLILNFKTFEESSGENLDKIMNEIAELSDSKIYIAPEVGELVSTKEKFPSFNIISQNVDDTEVGKSTGWLPPEILLENDIDISIYNHSEHRVWDENILNKITNIQAKGLKLIVCCQDLSEAAELIKVKPFAIAYEPPDLIGSGISVTTRPEVVKEFINIVPDGILQIIGAGVSTGEDVKSAIELGADGVLVASAFVKASDHKAKLQELLNGFGL